MWGTLLHRFRRGMLAAGGDCSDEKISWMFEGTDGPGSFGSLPRGVAGFGMGEGGCSPSGMGSGLLGFGILTLAHPGYSPSSGMGSGLGGDGAPAATGLAQARDGGAGAAAATAGGAASR